MDPKPLYRAIDINGLKNPDVKVKDIKDMISDSDAAYRKFEHATDIRDEELAYESLKHYLKIITKIQKMPAYQKDKRYYDTYMGKERCNYAIDTFEILHVTLQRRYADKAAKPILVPSKSNGSLNRVQPQVPRTLPDVPVHDFQPTPSTSITAKELIALVNNHQVGVLLMDCRPAVEFEASQLHIGNCLNVPEEIIKKGMSAGKVQSALSLSGKALWASRSTKDHVILMDWNSGASNVQEPLRILKDILLNWDPDAQYKNPLRILEDGFEGLKRTYPMHVSNPHYEPRQTIEIFDDGLDNVEYPNFNDIKMKEDVQLPAVPSAHSRLHQPTFDRSKKEAVLQRQRQFVREQTTEVEKGIKKVMQMELDYNETTKIAETLPESDAKIGELVTKKIELINKIIELDDLNKIRQNEITNSLDEQRAVIEETDPDDPEQTQLVEHLEQVQRQFEQERRPLAMRREQATGLDYARARRIEQNNNVVVPPRPAQPAHQPTFDRSVKPTFVEEPPVIRSFNAESGGEGHGLTGLKNLGNTCYMNSIMQCLSNTPRLKDFFIEDDGYRKQFHRGARDQRAIAEEFSAVIREIWMNKHRHISSNDLRRVIGQCKQIFRGMDQQDSHEFLTILMDWLHVDLQSKQRMTIPSVKLSAAERAWQEFVKCEESYIMKLFYGQIKSTVKCFVCNGESATYEGFSNLSLELPPSRNKCSIDTCLRMYFYGERISGWNCPRCKLPRDAIKKLDITKLPPILVIHFKRFNVDLDSSINRYTKKQNFVQFPLTGFDVSEYIAPLERSSGRVQKSVYQLYGVSNHYGTMERGHYTAFCKSSYYGKWFKYDDHLVSPMDSSDVTSSAAYILFYTSI